MKIEQNPHPNHKKVIDRLARISGHTAAIKKMFTEGRDCSEVLMQIAAVKSALTNVGKLILNDHIDHCLVRAIEEKNEEVITELKEAIEKLIK